MVEKNEKKQVIVRSMAETIKKEQIIVRSIDGAKLEDCKKDAKFLSEKENVSVFLVCEEGIFLFFDHKPGKHICCKSCGLPLMRADPGTIGQIDTSIQNIKK